MEREIILNQDIQELQGKLHESTIAHEIGHWLMHVTQYEAENLRKEINNNLEVEETQNIFLCRSIIEQLDTYKVNIKHDHIECQAEYFASCLLMPTFKLEEVRRGRDLTNWRHLYAMQDDLGVTISNLINRLQDLGWIYIPEGSKQIYPRTIESADF
jgi:Zn-dependent peptidase ImmA (M78 family)